MPTLTSFETKQAQRVEHFFELLNWSFDRLGLNVPQIVHLETLRSLPLGTLGHAWAAHLDENQLQPFERGPRRQQLHDGVHTLTGYGTDPLGEAEVQAFLLGAKFRLPNLAILAGLLRGLQRHRHHQLLDISQADLRSRLRTAYQRGCNSQFDPDRWQPEQLWDQPLLAVQAQFGLTPSP